MSALLNAAAGSSTLDSKVIVSRNASVDKQLNDNGFKSVDVGRDGNCYFRALSLVLYGNENNYDTLRQAIMQHLATISNKSADVS